MNNIDLVLMGIKNLWRRKLRTFLTILGVIIGASSIIVMLSLGFGMTKAWEDQVSQWGSLTTINVHKRWMDMPMGGGAPGGQKQVELDDKAVMSFREIPNVTAVSPILETYGLLVNGKYIAHTPIKGVDPESMEAFDFEIEEGRLLEASDDMVIVFGGGMVYNFHDPKSRVWREVKVDLMKDRMLLTFDTNRGYPQMPGENRPKYKDYRIKTAGVLKEGNWETSYGIYMPINTVKKLIKEKEKAENIKPQPGRPKETGYQQVNVKVNDMNNVQEVQKIIKDMGHDAYSLNDSLESMKETAGTMQAILGGIGAISLLVAAIGITNTMVMSIYERTKEIGIMKVIGASIKDIKRLFLFESALIGLLGGIFGVGFSYFLSFLVNKFGSGIGGGFFGMGGGGSKISIIPIWLSFAALGFSALIGLLSGYYPARRAMNLSALDAIRTE